MATKTEYLQIRLTPEEKAELKRRAEEVGQDLSTFVMSRTLPPAGERFREILRMLSEEGDGTYALAALHDFLVDLAPTEFSPAVEDATLDALSPFLQSYVAAMVEVAADQKQRPPPRWTTGVAGVDEPYFATPLRGLRLYLLQVAPVPFKRRNLFVDATLGARV